MHVNAAKSQQPRFETVPVPGLIEVFVPILQAQSAEGFEILVDRSLSPKPQIDAEVTQSRCIIAFKIFASPPFILLYITRF